jgi:hypothetical protein
VSKWMALAVLSVSVGAVGCKSKPCEVFPPANTAMHIYQMSDGETVDLKVDNKSGYAVCYCNGVLLASHYSDHDDKGYFVFDGAQFLSGASISQESTGSTNSNIVGEESK